MAPSLAPAHEWSGENEQPSLARVRLSLFPPFFSPFPYHKWIMTAVTQVEVCMPLPTEFLPASDITKDMRKREGRESTERGMRISPKRAFGLLISIEEVTFGVNVSSLL